MEELSELTAAEIKAARVLLNMSQVDFAAALGISRRNVENWESEGPGSRTPPVYLRFAIAAVMAGLEPWKA